LLRIQDIPNNNAAKPNATAKKTKIGKYASSAMAKSQAFCILFYAKYEKLPGPAMH
jgi:hypothetical protein